MQKIFSWNVASIRARLPALTKLLLNENPDIVLLQEIKAEESNFPFFELQTLGYHAVIWGQKSYNGVAILSKKPLTHVVTFPFVVDAIPQARFIQAEMDNIVFISVYVPNGNSPEKAPEDNSKLIYKLKWLEALTQQVTTLLETGKQIVLGGDFNVIEYDSDVYDPEIFRHNALMLPEVRQRYAQLTQLPIINAIRLKNPEPHTYSFWDFQMGAWPRNRGILLDALYVNKELESKIHSAGVLKSVRGWEKTSDHAPIFLILQDQ